MLKVNKSEQIRKLYDEGKSVKQIKAKVKCSHALIAVVLRNYRKKLRKSKVVTSVVEMKKALNVVEKPKVTRKELLKELLPGIDACFGLEKKVAPPTVDHVNHPPHYKTGGVETIDFIEAKDLNYRLGNVVKYVSRAGRKGDPIQDLEKAAWYLQREITARKNA